MSLTKKHIVTLFALCFPILSPLSADDHEIQPVSFQAPGPAFPSPDSARPSTIPSDIQKFGAAPTLPSPTGRGSSCPDLYQPAVESSTICAISGVVDRIQLGQDNRIAWVAVRIGQQEFYYFPKGNDTTPSLGLFTASKIHQIPVSLRYQNWGGRQYITEANF